jgi:hypothetical protein
MCDPRSVLDRRSYSFWREHGPPELTCTAPGQGRDEAHCSRAVLGQEPLLRLQCGGIGLRRGNESGTGLGLKAYLPSSRLHRGVHIDQCDGRGMTLVARGAAATFASWALF